MPTEKTMASTRGYEPIEPDARKRTDVENLRAQWRASPLRFRILGTTYLVIGAWGGLVGSHLLISAYSNWLTWSVALLILEPIGVTSLAALVFFYWPSSWVGRVLAEAIRRAKIATLIIGVCVLGWIAWVIVYFGVQFWKLR